MYKPFRTQFDALCEEKKLRYRDIALRMGQDPSRVSHIIRRNDGVDPATIEKVADAFGVSPLHFDRYVVLKAGEVLEASHGLLEMVRESLASKMTPKTKKSKIA